MTTKNKKGGKAILERYDPFHGIIVGKNEESKNNVIGWEWDKTGKSSMGNPEELSISSKVAKDFIASQQMKGGGILNKKFTFKELFKG